MSTSTEGGPKGTSCWLDLHSLPVIQPLFTVTTASILAQVTVLFCLIIDCSGFPHNWAPCFRPSPRHAFAHNPPMASHSL